MNINVNRITQVLIKDENGKVVEQFQFGGVGVVTLRDKTQQLEIHKAPKLQRDKKD